MARSRNPFRPVYADTAARDMAASIAANEARDARRTAAAAAPRTHTIDRTASGVAAAFGQTGRATGRCHYCGMGLNRRGYCEECA